MSKTCVILNPSARGERARRWTERLRAMCDGALFCATIRAGEAEQLARAAIESVSVLGAFQASASVRSALSDRIR